MDFHSIYVVVLLLATGARACYKTSFFNKEFGVLQSSTWRCAEDCPQRPQKSHWNTSLWPKHIKFHTISCDVGHPGKHQVSHACMVGNAAWERHWKGFGGWAVKSQSPIRCCDQKSWQGFVCVRWGSSGRKVGSGWWSRAALASLTSRSEDLKMQFSDTSSFSFKGFSS